jgi:hypothetical protein
MDPSPRRGDLGNQYLGRIGKILRLQFIVSISGDLGGRLNNFRERLQLTKRGRLSDEWDEEFGYRIIRAGDEGLVRLDLDRYADDEWEVSLAYEKEPLPGVEVEELLDEIFAAAAAVGVTATGQSP